ncbi:MULTISPECIES: methylmalonyl-CoA mutase family protein [unclassified Streptomyces]|uniref:methylmalonyl-CoA mutase family protein n=1 Tax=unclassified Streptomyces TaxID=2593676 RepID=UPI000DBAD3A6|nr:MULTISPECIES: methylmalonyl-CoA mutase family protein [unclassified Streptomyces]MYT69136.1 methylmalonyl-CoA mutase [Streptomyces sp. SID8367]RAJ82648.1 methylmalonyl-CoA mutase [Streptomyces sp. PsTaAH-137]
MTVLPDDGLSLAAEFPDATHDQWQQLVAGVLRKSGREVSAGEAEDALSTTLEDGLRARPLYTSNDAAPPAGLPGFPPFVRGGRAEGNTAGGWDVRQRHGSSESAAVLTDLENGVTSLWLTIGDAGGFPVSALPAVLDGVLLDLAPVVLDAGADQEGAARELLRLYEHRGVAADAARGNLGGDPLGLEARTGRSYDSEPVVELARLCAERYPGLRALTVDALPYHEAGGSAAQELGASLATGVAYLRHLTEAGLDVQQALAQVEFRYAATADQFLTIAKFRAARRLWARVAEACGAPRSGAQLQHAVTSTVMTTRRDPWVNMLRSTVATLAAGVGGADAVTVLPFDDALGVPDAFARRVARNTSTILIEESHLARVIDPAGGSWYVERLTDELAHAAWEFFQTIEREGGQAAALRSGLVGDRLAETWSVRAHRLAERREPVTGVSEFPHLAEKPVVRAAAAPRPSGGLPRVRRDEAFEALRARSDAHLAATGRRPRVYLAALGPAAAHTARATFAANLFQAGGIEPVTDGSFEESGAREACLCSSDTVYAEQAEDAARSLREAGASHVFLAGRPGTSAAPDSFVFAGCDAVEVLSATLDRMGVSR